MHPWRTQIAQSSNAKSFNIQIKGGLKESNLVHHVILISMIFIQCNFRVAFSQLRDSRGFEPYFRPFSKESGLILGLLGGLAHLT